MKKLKSRLTQVCESFLCDRFELPHSLEDLKERLILSKNQLNDTYNTLIFTLEHFKKYLESLNKDERCTQFSIIKIYKLYIIKSRLILSTLNKFKHDQRVLVGLFWVPQKNVNEILQANQNSKRKKGFGSTQIQLIEDHKLTPPTHFETNEFIYPFHEIVQTYGTPSYKEVNPTVFNIVTFPFLFGVMFGDIGHGFLLFAVASYLCMRKEQIQENYPSFDLFIKIRYLLLMMGFFATFCGFIYNDMMAMPFNLFGSCYVNKGPKQVVLMKDCIYPFGIDPKWYVSPGELAFMNSLKMKTSVIFGVAQMLLGILLKGFNNVYFRQWIDFFFEFIP